MLKSQGHNFKAECCLFTGMQLYGYVHDTNSWIDIFGLNEINDLGQIGEKNAGIMKNTKTIPAPSGKRNINYITQ